MFVRQSEEVGSDPSGRRAQALLEARVLAGDRHAGALVELLRAGAVPRVDDEPDLLAAAPPELGHRLAEEGGPEPAAPPVARDGELSDPAFLLVVGAEDAAD